jgi:hypothetical protein
MLNPAPALQNAVEGIAYFCHCSTGSARPPANVGLIERLDRCDALARHALRDVVAGLAEVLSRGELVSLALRVAAGVPVDDRWSLGERLSLFSTRLLDFELGCGELLGALVAEERSQACCRIGALSAALDPIGDLSRLLREPLSMSVEVVPSLLLPPPQEGRHGASHTADGYTRSWLSFGFPLSSPPERYGIDRDFLRFGAWAYGIRTWLASAAPAFQTAEGMPELRCMLAELAPAGRTPEALLRSHLDLALRNELGRAIGTTEQQFRMMAKARGLRWFDWFAEWVSSRRRMELPLRHQLSKLPRALLDSKGELEQAPAPEFPSAINLVLMSAFRGRPSLVVPDCWPEAWCKELLASWSPLQLPLLRYGDWYRAAAADGAASGHAAPAIAVGSPEDNPLVAALLQLRELDLCQLDGLNAPLLVALERPAATGEPWYLVLATRHSALAAALPLETLLRLTATWAWLDGFQVVRSGKDSDRPVSRDAASQDTALQDAASQDTALQDAASQDTALQDRSSREHGEHEPRHA